MLHEKLSAIPATALERTRPSHEILEEVLDTVRRMERVVTVDGVKNINNILDAVQRMERVIVPADGIPSPVAGVRPIRYAEQ